MVQLQRKEKQGGKKRGRARTGRVDGHKKEKAQTLWGILYADDAGIVPRSPEGLEKMMTVILTVCRVRADGLGGQDGDHVPANERWGARAVHRYCSWPGVQTGEFVSLGGAISADWGLRSVEVTRRIQRAWAYFGLCKYGNLLPSECAFTPEGADAESRGNGDTSTRVCHVQPEQG